MLPTHKAAHQLSLCISLLSGLVTPNGYMQRTSTSHLPVLPLATRPLEKSPGTGEVLLSHFTMSRLLQYSHLFC